MYSDKDYKKRSRRRREWRRNKRRYIVSVGTEKEGGRAMKKDGNQHWEEKRDSVT